MKKIFVSIAFCLILISITGCKKEIDDISKFGEAIVTGFNPNETYHGAEKQYMVGSVCFIGHYDMYKTFKEKRKASDLSRFTVFDDKNKTVWISWYDYV